MSFRDPYHYDTSFLILNALESSISSPLEKHLIEEYKKLSCEKDNFEKKMNILAYARKRTLFSTVRIKILRKQIDKKQELLDNIANSAVLKGFLAQEQNRRKKLQKKRELENEQKAAEDAKKIIEVSAPTKRPDEYYDNLWEEDEEEFWRQVKLEWRAKYPDTTHTNGIPFEKRCEYLSWMLGVSSKWSIVEMRNKLISTNKIDAETLSVFEVIDRHDYYFPMIKQCFVYYLYPKSV